MMSQAAWGPVSACVINYQGRERIAQVIHAVEASSRPVDELIVVDSASTDGSAVVLRRRYPHVRLIALEENRGPAFARNRGYEAASHDRLVFIDNDIQVHARCIEWLVRTLDEREEAVITLPSVRLREAPDVVQFEGADCHFLGLMALRRAGEHGRATVVDSTIVGSMVSACFAVHRGRMGRQAPFDESFGFNYEDHELGVRCGVLGYVILAVPRATCLHGEGTLGLSVRGDEVSPPGRMYHLMRGRWVVMLKCFNLRTLIVLAPALLLYESVQLAFILRHGRLGEWALAARWILVNFSDVRRQRRSIQSRRERPDRALLIGGPLPFRPRLARTRLEEVGLTILEGVCNLYWRAARHLV